ncbi:MAG: hypothetical protein IJ011_05365 [Clostridia bacterium]|nr:hypothetical protein [Clostridia bacterium]
MAAIGGIFMTDGKALESKALMGMSRAMLARGGKRREAFIDREIGLFFGRGEDGERPFASSDEGDGSLLLCDGEVYDERESGGERARFFGESDAELSLEAYRKYGGAMGEHISGEFAIAAYDRQKKELLLLRDPMGARPLYYIKDRGRVAFASEIKGLLGLLGSVEVDRGVLREHIFSPCGRYGGGDIYKDILEVGRSGGCVCSRLTVAPFTYSGEALRRESESRRTVFGGFACPDGEGMARLLTEILFAFDYPQFDALMPSFIRDLSRAAEVSGAVSDGTLCSDIFYSAERSDRLFCMSSFRCARVAPEKSTAKERELKRMESVMKELLIERDGEALAYIFGKDWEGDIRREKNTAKRIRVMGMMWQAVLWYESYCVTFT